MTVRELIEQLAKLPAGAPVLVRTGQRQAESIVNLEWVGGSDTPPGGAVFVITTSPDAEVI